MNNRKQNVLDDDRIGHLLLKLSLPAGIGLFVMTLYNVVDTIFIGHAVGTLGIAGLSIVFPVQMLILGIGLMIGIGGASLISRCLGTRDFQKAERTLGNAIFLTVILGALLTIAGLSNSNFWVRLFGASEAIFPYAKDYIDVILMGTIFQIFSVAASHLVRAEGNARVPMISMLIGALLNILLDALFIFTFRMGVQGAAIATVISQVVTALYLIGYYQLQNSSLKVHVKNFIPEHNVMREIISIGFASSVMVTAGSLVIMSVNRMLVAYGGDSAVAAYGILHRVMMFVLMPLISVAQGLQPILGFNYGAKRADRALKVIKLSVVVTTIFSVIAFLVLFFFPALIMRIFTTDNSLIIEGSQAAELIFIVVFLVGFQVVGSTVFQAIGKAIPAFFTAASRQIFFLLPLILILPQFLQLNGIWLSFPIADVLSFILTLALFIPQIREFRGINRQNLRGGV